MVSQDATIFSRHHFLLRRLHSLTGIIPVGFFLIEHLLTNSLAFLGQEHFNAQVQWIQDMHYLIALEILFIFLPLAYHGLYGVKIALEGRPNQNQYPYMDNWRYTLQRVTAWITLVFVIGHLAHFRFGHYFGVNATYADASENVGYWAFTQEGFYRWLPVWAWMIFYVIGLTAAVFHFANGIGTFCITWGITVGDISRKRVSLAAGGLGVILLIWGIMTLIAFGTFEVEAPKAAPAGAEASVVAEH